MDSEERNNLFRQISDLRKEINALTQQAKVAWQEKEQAFHKKRSISRQIHKLIQEFKTSHTKRDELKQLVQGSKEKRSQLNAEVAQKLGELKQLHQQKKEIIQKHHIQFDPSKIKKEMEDLEFKMETEAFSLNDEKKLNAIIKEKKKQYEASKHVSDIFDKISVASKELEKFQHKADEAHKKVRERAEKGQEEHKEMVDTSKTIDTWKKQEREASAVCELAKKAYEEVEALSKPKFDKLKELQDTMDILQQEHLSQKQKQDVLFLQQKKSQAEEKLHTRKKLTNEDILAMQGRI